MSFLNYIIYTRIVLMLLYPNQSQQLRTSHKSLQTKKDKSPVHTAHSSMPGACPYLTVMVNILTLLAKGDRRRIGGREDRFLEDVEVDGKVEERKRGNGRKTMVIKKKKEDKGQMQGREVQGQKLGQQHDSLSFNFN